jgi:EmrB/QacA subfamily drug resistance transporter
MSRQGHVTEVGESAGGGITESAGLGSKAGPGGWWPLVAIVLAVSMLMLDATVVTVALPDMQRDLGASLTDLQWVMNAYTLAMAAFQLTAGSLADRLGRRRMFTIGVALFAVSSLVCGLAPSAGMLITARVVQGLAGAVMFATTLALIAQCYQGRARGIAFGVRGTVAGVAVVAGPLVGGALVASLNWRWIFLVNLPVAALTLAIAWRRLPRREELHRGRRLDTGGPVILAATLVLLVFALLRGNDDGWASTRVLLMFATAAVGLIAFLILEHRHPNPMLDLTLFRGRTFVGTQLGSLTVQGSLFALFVYLSLYFQDHLGYSALQAGLSFLPVVAPILVAGALAGAFMDRLPARMLVAGGLALLSIGLVLMHGLTPDSNWVHLTVGMVMAGFACGIILPVLGSLAVDVADQRRLGMASGVNNTVLQIGFAVGIAVYGAVLGHQAPTNQGFVTGLNQLFLIAAAVAALGALLTLTLIRGRRPEPGATLR